MVKGKDKLDSPSYSVLDERLSPKEQDFCKYLDDKFAGYKTVMEEIINGKQLEKLLQQEKKPAALFRSGLTLFRKRDQYNEDRVSQASHSIREIFYEYTDFYIYIGYIRGLEITPNERKIFGKIYGYFSDGAHHRSSFDESQFEFMIAKFQKNFRDAIEGYSALKISEVNESVDYIHIFKVVHRIINNGPNRIKNSKVLNEMIYEVDSNIYWHFFENLTPRWLDCLDEHRFLSEKINTSDPQDYNSGTGEMTFLERSARSNPMGVVDILMKIKDPQNLSNHIIRIFLNICIDLPKDEFSRLIPKVLDENWLYVYYKKVYANDQYKKIMTRLLGNQDYHNYALKVCETALTLKEVEYRSKSTLGNSKVEDFIIDMLDIREIGIFSYLLDLTMKGYLDKVLITLISKTNKLIFDYNQAMQGDNSEQPQVNQYGFQYYDPLGITSTDVSFIDGKIEMPMYTSNHDGLKYLMFILNKTLSDEIIKNTSQAANIYQKYINNFKCLDANLVDSPVTWRLRLHLVSLAPDEFKEESKKLLFHLFEKESFSYAIQSEEYFIALKNNFYTLETEDQEKYIDDILHIYESYNGKYPDYIKDKVCNVLGMLEKYIKASPSIQEKLNAQDISPDYKYKPAPNDAFKITVSWDAPITPLGQKEFSEMPISDIAKKLRTEWSPEEIDKKNNAENFMSPSDVSGVGKLLESDIPNRFSAYCEHAGLFFEKNILDAHYTYFYFIGMNQAIKDPKIKISEKDLESVLNLYIKIIISEDSISISKDVDAEGYKSAILSMTDFLRDLLGFKDSSLNDHLQKNRSIIISIIRILLTASRPLVSEEESMKSANSFTTTSSVSKVSDPFFIAINSIRGRAYQLFVNFMCFDSRASDTGSSVIIADDVKKIYEDQLQREETRAINFLFGHYLSYFYFRDKEWTRKLIPEIFPVDTSKKHLYTAAWEGFITGRGHGDMMLDSVTLDIYLRGLELTDKDFPSHQNHFTDPTEKLTEIIALGHICSETLNVDHQLYKNFWKKTSIKYHKHFIEVIGREIFYRENYKYFIPGRVENLWSYMLKEYKGSTEPVKDFGNFITLKGGIFKKEWLIKMVICTLEKTEGELSEYYPLRENIIEFAKQSPLETLKIIELVLARRSSQDNTNNDILGGTGKEWVEAFRVIYDQNKNSKKTKNKCRESLGKLLKFHSWMFAEFVDK